MQLQGMMMCAVFDMPKANACERHKEHAHLLRGLETLGRTAGIAQH